MSANSQRRGRLTLALRPELLTLSPATNGANRLAGRVESITFLGAVVRIQVITRPNVMFWLRRTFAVTYVLLAGRLAAESR